MRFPCWLPSSRDEHSYQLALFATYCWRFGWTRAKAGNSAPTVLSKLSHVSWHHQRACDYSVGLTPGHRLAITGMRRFDPPSSKKSPVTKAMLRTLHKQLNFEDIHDRVLWGATVMGFFFLLRRSEYLPQGRNWRAFALNRSDIKFLDKGDRPCVDLARVVKVVVLFRGSKTNQFGEGITRVLGRSGAPSCCPVLTAWFLVSHHKSIGAAAVSPLCCVSTNLPLQDRDVTAALKSAAAAAGDDPRRYGTHSLRSGGATVLLNSGVDSLAVKLSGRWKLDAVERYTSLENQLSSQMAVKMILNN